jgi:hypothetical protein
MKDGHFSLCVIHVPLRLSKVPHNRLHQKSCSRRLWDRLPSPRLQQREGRPQDDELRADRGRRPLINRQGDLGAHAAQEVRTPKHCQVRKVIIFAYSTMCYSFGISILLKTNKNICLHVLYILEGPLIIPLASSPYLIHFS